MVCTRRKLTLKSPHNKNLENPTTTNIFENLISALESHEDIKSQLLKSSYNLLIQLSLKQQLCLGEEVDLNELFVKTDDGDVRLTFRDVYTLSSVLFKVLKKRLMQLHSSKHDVTPSQSLELEEVNLLIRCCLVSLTLRVPQEHFLESGRVFLLIFKKLSLLEVTLGSHENADYNKSHSCQCMYIGEKSSDSFAKVASLSSLELSCQCIPSMRAILEVLIDELLVHGRLRTYLQIIDSLSSSHERLFKHGTKNGNFGVLMEIICSHFAISISDEGALDNFLNRITWVHYKSSESLELSIITARTLLQNPVVLSSPKLLQAHIVALVSDVISVSIDSETPTPGPRLIDCYLSLFKSSVTLYTQHMSIMKTESHSADARSSLVNSYNESSQPSFESCINPIKRQKLNQMILTLNDSWNSNLRRNFFRRESDLVASSTEYIQQNMCILDKTWREDILCFLRCMLARAANDVNDIELPFNGEDSLQDICLLSSLLMLMSNSLIQAVWCLRYRHSDSDILVCKEYDVIVGIISCFKEYSIRLPIQKFSHDLMERNPNPTRHKESKLMLLHFIGLVSLCFDSRLDFLVKSCISAIMALTNLFVLEEGNIDVLRSLADPRSLSSQGSLTIYKEALVCQSPTLQVAAKFQKIRTLYVSNASAANESTLTEDVRMENLSSTLVPFSMEGVAVTEETCSGELYLKTRLKGSGNVTDFDDLADFVECKKDRDYVGWLTDRDKFREWKLRKRVKRKREKIKQAWRSMR